MTYTIKKKGKVLQTIKTKTKTRKYIKENKLIVLRTVNRGSKGWDWYVY